MEYYNNLKKKERDPTICNNMGEPGGHHASKINQTW